MPQSEANKHYIRIGVTGHRRLDDPAAVEALVKRAIDAEAGKLCQKNIDDGRQAGTEPVSFCVVSPLAEGADRVVARAVLASPNARLNAVIPLALQDYLEDFATEKSRAEFAELLSRCAAPVFLRTRLLRHERQDAAGQAELRRDAYAQAGRYVVDHCDLLIAVWNGEPTGGRGGTAEIVEYARKQNRPILRVWDGAFEVLGLHP